MSERLYLNGIDAETGDYLVEPLTVEGASAMLRGVSSPVDAPPGLAAVPPDGAKMGSLRRMALLLGLRHLGLPYGVNPAVVAQAGWAVVFHAAESSEVRRALEPLVSHRRRQIGPARCKELDYRPGEKVGSWLTRHGASAGSIDPLRVPYYLLLIGGPDRVPFQFCHELDVEYAVGCVHFDTPVEYERYARSVVEYETSRSVRTGRDALFFATRHDPATQLSADRLVRPLASGLRGLRKSVIIGEGASKAALSEAFVPNGCRHSPAIVFTASHGMGWRDPTPLQPSLQGALICQNWEPAAKPKPADWFCAADIPADANLHGLIAFSFACYGAGTPLYDRFIRKPEQPRRAIAERPFLAALPKALLAHPNGGALAFIGHVERAWGYSIVTPTGRDQLLPFKNAHALARQEALAGEEWF